jgi:hypothetical protein
MVRRTGGSGSWTSRRVFQSPGPLSTAVILPLGRWCMLVLTLLIGEVGGGGVACVGGRPTGMGSNYRIAHLLPGLISQGGRH